MKSIAIIAGTRPEVIKLAPVVNALKNHSIKTYVISTSQHNELFESAANDLSFYPDIKLDVDYKGLTLSETFGTMLSKISEPLKKIKPSAILAQGDTLSVLTSSTYAFLEKIPFGHVEAGLRSWDLNHPFPEEYIRRNVGITANWNFCPTKQCSLNLLREGVDKNRVYVTGNTVIDSLHLIKKNQNKCNAQFSRNVNKVLVTIHRRENHGQTLLNICNAITLITKMYNIEIVWPIHYNPNVRTVVLSHFQNNPNVRCIEPLGYRSFVNLMLEADIIISDSGGIQEEAPALGKPVLVVRETTERPEALDSGVTKLIGTSMQSILDGFGEWFNNTSFYEHVKRTGSPYGDGQSSERIASIIMNTL